MSSEESSPLILVLDELEEGVCRRDFETTAAALALEDADFAFQAPVQVHLQIRRALETYTLSGLAETRAAGECCRCLARSEVPLQAEISLLFQRKEASADELEAALEEEGVEFISPGATEMDLTGLIHEAVLLALPARIYCREDCRGLCAQCGQDLNAGPCGCVETRQDSRWEALRNVEFS
jgi:DUF177 domain-containing protein